jgi:hypothetical protein
MSVSYTYETIALSIPALLLLFKKFRIICCLENRHLCHRNPCARYCDEMSLLNLPHELLLSICDCLAELRCVSALAQTNQKLYWHLVHYLYTLDVLRTGGSALTWAAQNGSRRTAWLSLAGGADIETPRLVQIPLLLKHLEIHRAVTCMTPLQVALCYGSDTVARFLLKRGAVSSSLFPLELCSCTSLHMAAAMALPSTLKILISQGLHVETRDSQFRTPLHYAAAVPHQDSVKIAQVVMRLLLNNADPWTADSKGSCPISIGKRRTNPVARMLPKKGAAIAAYEVVITDEELFEDWRTSKENQEEAAWEDKRAGFQANMESSRSTQAHQPKRRKRRARKQKDPVQRSQKADMIVREREALNEASKDATDRTSQCPAIREQFAEASTETDQAESYRIELWSKMRKDADLRSLTEAWSGLNRETECKHASGLWMCRGRKICRPCGILAKRLSLCVDCEFVVCQRCNSGTEQD